MKTGTFRKVKFEISRMSGYGHYLITATYKGKEVKAVTTDSEAWDWIDDDSNKYMHDLARKHCYYAIVKSYELYYL